MEILELIKKITEFHPAYDAGRKRNWSYYVGGMGDHGDWYYQKLLNASKEELQACLDELIEESKPIEKKLTPEEEADRDIVIISSDKRHWMTLYDLKKLQAFRSNFEHCLIWGNLK